MCRAVTCRVCGRTTWAGCGEHIESVRREAASWCEGNHSAAEVRAAKRSRGGILARLFGR